MVDDENKIRRRARALNTFLDAFSDDENDEKKENVIDFNKVNFNIARIPQIPEEIKDEVSDNPNSLWSLMDAIKEILSSILMTQNQENSDTEKSHGSTTDNSDSENTDAEIEDAVSDQFDDSIPDDYKIQLSNTLQKRFDDIMSGLGKENADYMKSRNDLKEELQNSISDQLKDKRQKSNDDFKKGKELSQTAEKEKRKDEILKDFGITSGSKPGSSAGKLSEGEFKTLEKYSDELSKSKDLQKLARVLGRSEKSDNDEEDKNSGTPVKERKTKSRAYRGNVVGFEYSNDISRIVPSELSLLKNPQTENLFYHKFAEKQLLSYCYEQKGEGNEVNHREEKGPVILCIDTSGSMMGTPEEIAKAAAFSISRTALREKRSCYLISFSVSTNEMSFENFSAEQGFRNLLNFLKLSFNGGTDVEPALESAIKQLETNTFQNADILVISDFEMNNLGPVIKKQMKIHNENGTRFHSLLIDHSGGNKNVLDYFNYNWIYEGNSKGQGIRISMTKNNGAMKEEKLDFSGDLYWKFVNVEI